MRISDLSIRKPVFAWMLMFGLILFGAIAFWRMGVSQLPDVDFPVVTVTLNLEGAAPEIMETTVIDPVEDALMSIQGIRSLESSARYGTASVTAEFELDRDIDLAVQEIQTKVAQAQRLLPKDVDPPIITKVNPDDQPILWLAVTTTNPDPKYLMTYTKDILKDKFSVVEGVGDIMLGGYTDPSLRVWIKPDALKIHNVGVDDIISAIEKGHNEVPGGQIENEKKNFNVRTLGEAKTPAEFASIVIDSRAGMHNQNFLKIVKLGEVANIEEGLADVHSISRFMGDRALGIGIRKQKGSNAVGVAHLVKEKIKELQAELPSDIKLRINFDTTAFIEDSVHELNFTLILSAILTALACWIFLGSWSATLNVILAIPTSIVGAFIPLYFLGFTLNTFTLLGLSLAIGIVVDDAIMVLENIFRHREMGKGRIEGAIVGAREITFAAMAATIAIIAIFLPVAFMKGVIGKFFFQFGVTITFAVLLSLLEALTITPMRCAQFVDMSPRTTLIGRGFERLMELCRKFYSWSLFWALANRWKIVIASIVFLVISFEAVSMLKKEFSPSQDQSLFIIRLKTPVGSSLQYTDSQVKKVEAYLKSRPEVMQYYAAVGGMGGNGETNSGMAFVTMKSKDERPIDPKLKRPLSQQEFMNKVREDLKSIEGVRPIIQDLSMRGFTASRGFPVEFTIQGPDWEKLYEYYQIVRKQMEDSNLMTDVDTNYLLGMPEVQISPNRQAAALRGVNVEEIGRTVSALIGGVKVGQYPKNGHRYDIRVQIQKDHSNVDEIKNLYIANAGSNLIRMDQLIKQEVRPSLQQITRINRQRAITVFANVKMGASQQQAMEKVAEIGKNVLPVGYTVNFRGSAQTFKESFESLIFALLLGIIVAYMVLASQFNSFIDPISVLLALPFSVSGAFIALLLFGQSLNIYSMIGLILLMGIVKKNSILLVDFTNTIRDRGETDATKALLTACPVRLRPIIMTSFATIVGAIPPALAIGPGAETRVPMAIAIIGGVFVSTLLTLYVVPCTYSFFSFFQKREKFSRDMGDAFAKADNV